MSDRGLEFGFVLSNESSIGSGHHSEVHEVVDDKGEPCALKVYKDPSLAEREEKVAIMLGRDPRGVIVELKAIGDQVDQYGRVTKAALLERVDGNTLLRSVLEDGKFGEVGSLIDFWKTMADALDYARSRGFVCTDFNPGSVMVDSNDQPHLVDLSGFAQIDQVDDVFYTDRYSDPRIKWLQGVDETSDLYGMASLVYLMVVGVGPNEGRELKVKETRLPLDDERKKRLEKILNKARGNKGLFEKGYKNAKAVVQDLEDLLVTRP